jgi:hypothetical protein
LPKATITSFRVNASGVEKDLLLVIEKRNEGLILLPRRATQSEYREDAVSPTNNPYSESRISIHTSSDNPDGNLFHRTLITRDIRRDTYIWTEAIKKKSGFAPVYFKLCSPMQVAGYEPTRHDRAINIGDFDPRFFTLCYAVLVSSPERAFVYPHTSQPRWTDTSYREPTCFQYRWCEPLDFYTVDAIFKRFRLTLLVSYLGAPNPGGPHYFHHDTIDPADPSISAADLAYHQEAIKGRNEYDCIIDLMSVRAKLLEKFTEAAGETYDSRAAAILKFFAYPIRHSDAGRDHGRRLNLINFGT